MHSLIPQQPSTRYPYVCGQKPSFPGRVARVPGHAKGWQPDSPACLRGEKGRTRKRWCACFFSSRQSIRVLTGGVFARGRRRRIDDFLVSGTGKPSSIGYWPLRKGAHTKFKAREARVADPFKSQSISHPSILLLLPASLSQCGVELQSNSEAHTLSLPLSHDAVSFITTMDHQIFTAAPPPSLSADHHPLSVPGSGPTATPRTMTAPR